MVYNFSFILSEVTTDKNVIKICRSSRTIMRVHHPKFSTTNLEAVSKVNISVKISPQIWFMLQKPLCDD